jgi:hypothetical protein
VVAIYKEAKPMHVLHILQGCLQESIHNIHGCRLAAVWYAVASVIRGGRLSLTALGRAGDSAATDKHKIKRIDRLLGNSKLHAEVPAFYEGVTRLVLQSQRRPVVLVDWTPWASGFNALTASVAVAGRAVIVYGEVHRQRYLGNATVQQRFLKRLGAMLPANCTPIIVTDAGFKTPWFGAVTKLGWDYVGRLRGGEYVREPDCCVWTRISFLFYFARNKPQVAGHYMVTKRHRIVRRIITWSHPRRRRKKTSQLASKKIKDPSETELWRSRKAREPWVLVTSIEHVPARHITSIYALRMRTEESYRDLKNHRFGFCFEDARSRSAKRLSVLLLLGVLAMLASCLVGFIAEQRSWHRRYQANTVRKRRVLSWPVLGRYTILRGDDRALRNNEVLDGLAELLVFIAKLVPDGV